MVWSRSNRSMSFGPNTSLRNQLLPLDDVPRDELAQAFGRAAGHRQSLLGELFHDPWLTENLIYVLVVALDDCRRRSERRENAEPKLDFDSQALFDQCRQLRSGRRPLSACNRKKTNLTALHERQGAVQP